MPAQTKRKESTSQKESTESPAKKTGSQKGASSPSTRASTRASSKSPKKETGTTSAKRSKQTVSSEFLAHLITTKCCEMKLENMYTAKKDDKISDVWGKLIEKLIMAAPVVNDQGEFEGFVDACDIGSYLVTKFGDPMLRSSLGSNFDRLSEAMTKELKVWMDKTVGDVMAFDYPTKLRCPPVCYANYSLLSAVEPLAMMERLHRVAVVESPFSNRLITVITQSQVLNHINDNLNHLGSRKSKLIEECVDVVKTKGIFVVTKDHIALDAFQHMLKHGVSALAVVAEPHGQIKGVITLRDLQVIGNDGAELWRLYVGVETFLTYKTVVRVATVTANKLEQAKAQEEAKAAKEDEEKDEEEEEEDDEGTREKKTAEDEAPKKGKSSKKAKEVLSAMEMLQGNLQCAKGENFFSAVKKLATCGVHRLFVTDDNKVPVGVVSIKEVIKEILH